MHSINAGTRYDSSHRCRSHSLMTLLQKRKSRGHSEHFIPTVCEPSISSSHASSHFPLSPASPPHCYRFGQSIGQSAMHSVAASLKISPTIETPHRPLSFSRLPDSARGKIDSRGMLPRKLSHRIAAPVFQRAQTEGASPVRSSATEPLSTTLHTLEENGAPTPKERLADIWKEIQGSNHWEGMLDPMHPILREEIIRYGEFAQACYDAFDFDPFSKYCGCCKYNRRTFFEDLGMSDCGYEVTRYLYATSNINIPSFFRKSRSPKVWSSHANWMGMVAVAQDQNQIKRLGRRDIVISWRGTVTYLEWIANLMDFLKPAGLNSAEADRDVKVESGFLKLYTASEKKCRFCHTSARDQILAEVERLVEKYKGEELSITITGHSLGSALAMLSAYDLADMGLDVARSASPGEEAAGKIPITVFSFAGPRVGNSRFKERCEELGLRILRVVNAHDSVPKVPGLLFNEEFRFLRDWIDKLPWSYSHVGVELELDHTHSPFLKPTTDLSSFHNLEAHLHLLDGYHGRGRRFFLASGRDPALINKACDFLKDHHLVPPHWRQDENKGLLKNHEGRWVQPERNRADERSVDSHASPPPNVNGIPSIQSSVKS